MEILGLTNMIKFMDNVNKNFENEGNKLLKRVGTKFLKKVKLKTPVDTGHLRRSWNMEENYFRISIGTNVKYAIYLENGHRTRNGGYVEGRYMIKTTVEDIEKDLDEEFEILVENLWK